MIKKYRPYLISEFVKLKYLCVIEIESNPRHYNNGIIDLQKSPLSLMFLTWDGRLLKKVAAVS